MTKTAPPTPQSVALTDILHKDKLTIVSPDTVLSLGCQKKRVDAFCIKREGVWIIALSVTERLSCASLLAAERLSSNSPRNGRKRSVIQRKAKEQSLKFCLLCSTSGCKKFQPALLVTLDWRMLFLAQSDICQDKDCGSGCDS